MESPSKSHLAGVKEEECTRDSLEDHYFRMCQLNATPKQTLDMAVTDLDLLQSTLITAYPRKSHFLLPSIPQIATT